MQATSSDSSTLIDIESTISELAMHLDRMNSNFTESEELMQNIPIATANTATVSDNDENENTINKLITDDIENSSRTTELVNDSDTYDDSAYIIPIKIILPIPHIHAVPENGTFEQFNYILLQTNDSAYHGHLANDKPDILYPQNVTHVDGQQPQRPASSANKNNTAITPTTNAAINNSTQTNLDDLDLANGMINGSGSGAEPIDDNNIVTNRTIHLVDRDGFLYQHTKKYKILDDDGKVAVEFGEVAVIRPIEESIVTTTARSTGRQQTDDEQFDDHYSQILQWIQYKL